MSLMFILTQSNLLEYGTSADSSYHPVLACLCMTVCMTGPKTGAQSSVESNETLASVDEDGKNTAIKIPDGDAPTTQDEQEVADIQRAWKRRDGDEVLNPKLLFRIVHFILCVLACIAGTSIVQKTYCILCIIMGSALPAY